jgi:Tol biopolymer transport system component
MCRIFLLASLQPRCIAIGTTVVLGSAAAVATGGLSAPAVVTAQRRHAPIALEISAHPLLPTRCRGGVAGRTERVNISSDGGQTTTRVLRASISADGRFVAFSSAASTLVPGDRNGRVDVFVRDLRTRRTSRVSVSSTGAEGNGASFYPAINANGRFVSFRSLARNLVRDDRNDVEDVFVHDRATGVTERVSVGNAGREANGASVTSSISGDGRLVAFSSYASNLVRNDGNGVMDVFLRDRVRGRTIRVSVGSNGEADGASEGSGISRSGREVVFRSSATNLIRSDTNAYPDVFVRNWAARTTDRVNVSSRRTEANHETYRGSISGDGRRVGFRSEASNLVSRDTNSAQDVFVHDRLTNTTTRISVSTGGAQAYAPPSRQTKPGHRFMSRAFLSGTGRYAAFGSYAANLVKGDTNRAADVFERDLPLRRTVRVSVGHSGTQSNGDSFVMGISGDGSVVLFVSSADNLVPGDTNHRRDAFVRIRRLCAAT